MGTCIKFSSCVTKPNIFYNMYVFYIPIKIIYFTLNVTIG